MEQRCPAGPELLCKKEETPAIYQLLYLGVPLLQQHACVLTNTEVLPKLSGKGESVEEVVVVSLNSKLRGVRIREDWRGEAQRDHQVVALLVVVAKLIKWLQLPHVIFIILYLQGCLSPQFQALISKVGQTFSLEVK